MADLKGLKKTIFLFFFLSAVTAALGFTQLPWILSKPLMVETNIDKSPVIVVLYCGYGKPFPNGLNRYAHNRVSKGVDLWQQGAAPYILFSGGRSGQEAAQSGAEKMAREAIRQNIPRTRIIIEAESKDTRFNIRNTSLILKKKGWNHLVLVTDDYHIKRAMTLFREEGLTVFPAPVRWQEKGTWTHNWTYLRFLCYEIQARLAYLLLNDHQIDRIMNVLRPD